MSGLGGLTHSTVSSVLFFLLAAACAFLLGRIASLWSKRRKAGRKVCPPPHGLTPGEQRVWMSEWFAQSSERHPRRAKHPV